MKINYLAEIETAAMEAEGAIREYIEVANAACSQYEKLLKDVRSYAQQLQGDLENDAPPSTTQAQDIIEFMDARLEELGMPSVDPDAPRELTAEECTKALLDHFEHIAKYWAKQAGSVEDRMYGLVFSILTALDGDSMGLPKWLVVPDPHPSDREFHREEGENWWPENHHVVVKGGSKDPLHELWSARDKGKWTS